MRKLGMFGFALAILLAPVAGSAQEYPVRAVKIVVGFSAGGPTDLAARVVAERLTEKFGQAFVVENRLGANGAIAAQAVIGSPPDGYTLILGTAGSLTISPVLQKKPLFMPLTDLTPVALASGYPYVLGVSMDLPVSDVKGLIDYAKKNPGKISYTTTGAGSLNHLSGEWFKALAGIEMEPIHYKGDAATIVDLIAGRVQMGFITALNAMPQVKAGKVKGIAVTSTKQTGFTEALPTMIESGFPEFVVEPWNGILGPAGLPKEIVSKLNGAINEGLRQPEVQARLAKAGVYPIIESPEAFRQMIEQQTARWREVIKRANIPQE